MSSGRRLIWKVNPKIVHVLSLISYSIVARPENPFCVVWKEIINGYNRQYCLEVTEPLPKQVGEFTTSWIYRVREHPKTVKTAILSPPPPPIILRHKPFYVWTRLWIVYIPSIVSIPDRGWKEAQQNGQYVTNPAKRECRVGNCYAAIWKKIRLFKRRAA